MIAISFLVRINPEKENCPLVTTQFPEKMKVDPGYGIIYLIWTSAHQNFLSNVFWDMDINSEGRTRFGFDNKRQDSYCNIDMWLLKITHPNKSKQLLKLAFSKRLI